MLGLGLTFIGLLVVVLAAKRVSPEDRLQSPDSEVQLVFVGDIMLDGLPGQAVANGEDPFADLEASAVNRQTEVQATTGWGSPDDELKWRTHLDGRIDRLESMLQSLVDQRTVKDWYTTDEIAQLLGKVKFTVRQWCLLGRVNAKKKGSGRGKFQAWVVSHEELLRIQKEGLLPMPSRYRAAWKPFHAPDAGSCFRSLPGNWTSASSVCIYPPASQTRTAWSSASGLAAGDDTGAAAPRCCDPSSRR
jgi:hypothetical protein